MRIACILTYVVAVSAFWCGHARACRAAAFLKRRRPPIVNPIKIPAVAPADFEVHEWGVFTTHPNVEWANADMKAEWDSLPSFFLGAMRPGALRPQLPITVRKPIIYFHTKGRFGAQVEVTFRKGKPLVWYPGAMPSIVVRGEGVSQRHSLTWNVHLNGPPPPYRSGAKWKLRKSPKAAWLEDARRPRAAELYAFSGGYYRRRQAVRGAPGARPEARKMLMMPYASRITRERFLYQIHGKSGYSSPGTLEPRVGRQVAHNFFESEARVKVDRALDIRGRDHHLVHVQDHGLDRIFLGVGYRRIAVLKIIHELPDTNSHKDSEK